MSGLSLPALKTPRCAIVSDNAEPHTITAAPAHGLGREILSLLCSRQHAPVDQISRVVQTKREELRGSDSTVCKGRMVQEGVELEDIVSRKIRGLRVKTQSKATRLVIVLVDGDFKSLRPPHSRIGRGRNRQIFRRCRLGCKSVEGQSAVVVRPIQGVVVGRGASIVTHPHIIVGRSVRLERVFEDGLSHQGGGEQGHGSDRDDAGFRHFQSHGGSSRSESATAGFGCYAPLRCRRGFNSNAAPEKASPTVVQSF